MAPAEILLLLVTVHSIEIAIVAVLLAEILAVSAIFIVIPGVVVFAVPIVVALFVMVPVVRSGCDRRLKSGAQYKCAQN